MRNGKKTIDQEIKDIVKNDTWELGTLPKGHKDISVKWTYKIKENVKGEIEEHKSRLAIKGNNQRVGINYNEVFSLVADGKL